MGNEQGKTASPAEVRVPHVLKAQSQGDDEIDASRLDPKVQQWLKNAEERYSLTSVDRAAVLKARQEEEQRRLSGGTSGADIQITTVKKAGNTLQLDEELVKLEALIVHMRPLFPLGKGRDEFSFSERSKFDQNFPPFDLNALKQFLALYQTVLAKETDIVTKHQTILVARVQSTEILFLKAVHSTASLAIEFHDFEKHMRSVFEIQQHVKATHERVRQTLKTTFRLLDALPEMNRDDLDCPFDVVAPYLRKDDYTKTNFYKYTPWRQLQGVSERFEEMRQEDYWLDEILPRWDSLITTEEMGKFWRRGIPPRLRGHVWSKAIKNSLGITSKDYMDAQVTAQDRRDADPDPDELSPIKPGIHVRRQGKALRNLIERDLPRTFPELGFFDRAESIAYNEILKVLESAAVFSEHIGYVQGFSYVAAVFLLFMDHFSAFKAFCNIMDAPFFRSLSHMDLGHLSRHSHLFQLIFAHHAPELYEHFLKNDIACEHFILEWWLTVFSKSAELPVACRLWDCFFLEGEVFIHLAAVGILKLSEERLLKSNFEGCLAIIPQLPKEVDVETLMATIDKMALTPKILGVMEELEKENALFT